MKIAKEIKIIHDRSGFGIIHEVLAEDGNRYARKTFRPAERNIISDEDLTMYRRRFSREVRVQERLSSDYCIPIIYSKLDEEEPWFLMPIAEKTYQQEIEDSKKEGRLPEGLSDILNAMEYVHQRGYTHRDIKPGNILFHEGKWKLADMGLITSDPEVTTSFKTKTGEAFGSWPYMAPEQYTDFQNVNHQADIYSFGAILHDIFNGAPRKPYSKLSAKGSIGVIIEKCTEEQPDNRFRDVSALRGILLSKLSKAEPPKEIEEEAEEWQNEIGNFKSWNSQKLDAFVNLVEKNSTLKDVLFYEVSNEFIEHMQGVSERFWKKFVKSYLKWIKDSSFNFDYCDVLIGHVLKIYELTDDLSIMSDAVFAGAELARSHNRWYCMRKVVQMCSPKISDVFAERIAIEIHAKSKRATENLIRCLEGIHLDITEYHPEIREAIS